MSRTYNKTPIVVQGLPIIILPIYTPTEDGNCIHVTADYTDGNHFIGTPRKDGLLAVLTLHKDDIAVINTALAEYVPGNDSFQAIPEEKLKHFKFSWCNETVIIDDHAEDTVPAVNSRVNGARIEVNCAGAFLIVEGEVNHDWCEMCYGLRNCLPSLPTNEPEKCTDDEFEEWLNNPDGY